MAAIFDLKNSLTENVGKDQSKPSSNEGQV